MQFHQELSDKLWENNELKPEVVDKLNEIADAFIEFLEVDRDAIKDVVITGSMASYNYTQYSDVDLHLKVDYDKIHKDCPIVQGYLWQSKAMFNKNHDISIYGVPVEVYAESIDEDTVHNGLYSLWQEKWIDFPEKIKPTDNDSAVEAKFNEFKEMADNINDSEEAERLIDKLYEMRKAGLSEVGEFSTENLAFKKVRDAGILDKLKQMKKEKIDKQLSLESYNEDSNWSLERLRQLKNNIAKFNKEQSFYDPNAPKNGSEWSTRDLPNKYKERFNEICRKTCKQHLDILDKRYDLKNPKRTCYNYKTDCYDRPYETYIMNDIDIGTSIENIIYVGTGIITNDSSYIEKIKWDYGKELGLKLIQKIGFLPSREVKIYENNNLLILTEEEHFSTGYRGKIVIFDKHELDNLEKDIDKQLSLESYNEAITADSLQQLNKGQNNRKNESLKEAVKPNIDDYNFIDYRNPDAYIGAQMPERGTYRKALKSVADEIEQKSQAVRKTYWGETPAAKQFRIELYNIWGHSSVRDTLSPAANSDLKEQPELLQAVNDVRQYGEDLLKELEPLTQWNGEEWVKPISESLNESTNSNVRDVFKKYPYFTTGQAAKIGEELDKLPKGTTISYKADNSWHDCEITIIKTEVNKTFDDVKTNWTYIYSVDGKEVRRKGLTSKDVATVIREDDAVDRFIVQEFVNEAYISFEGHDFKGMVNSETGDIIYNTVTPKYRRILNADKKLNIKDTKLDTREWEVVETAKKALNKKESVNEDMRSVADTYGIEFSEFNKNHRWNSYDEIPHKWEEFITDSNTTFQDAKTLIKEKLGWLIEIVGDEIQSSYINYKIHNSIYINTKSKTTSVMFITRSELVESNYIEIADKIIKEAYDRYPQVFVESLKESYEDNIYKPVLIQQAYNIEQDWYKELGLGEDEVADEVMLFIIKDNKIVDTKKIKRKDVYTYSGDGYALVRSRDTGWVLEDYYLQNAKDFVASWNESKKYESRLEDKWKFYNDYREIGSQETEQIIEGILHDKENSEYFIEIYHTIKNRNNDPYIVINVEQDNELIIQKSCHDTPDYIKAELKEIFEQLKVDGYWTFPPEKMLQNLCKRETTESIDYDKLNKAIQDLDKEEDTETDYKVGYTVEMNHKYYNPKTFAVIKAIDYDVDGNIDGYKVCFENDTTVYDVPTEELGKIVSHYIQEKVEETKNYKRTRLCNPKTCKKDSFRTKTVNAKGDKIVLCQDKETGKMKAQSKLEKKNEVLNNPINSNTSKIKEISQKYINGEITAEEAEKLLPKNTDFTSLAIAKYNKRHGVGDPFDRILNETQKSIKMIKSLNDTITEALDFNPINLLKTLAKQIKTRIKGIKNIDFIGEFQLGLEFEDGNKLNISFKDGKLFIENNNSADELPVTDNNSFIDDVIETVTTKINKVVEALQEPVEIGTRVGTPDGVSGTVKEVNTAQKTVKVDIDVEAGQQKEEKEFKFDELDNIIKEALGE